MKNEMKSEMVTEMQTETRAAMKQELRRQMLAARKAISPEDRGRWSAEIVRRLASLPSGEAANIIFAYMPIGKEADITGIFPILWERGQQVAVPVCLPDQPGIMKAALLLPEMLSAMEPGMMHIPEPPDKKYLDPVEIDLVLAPGVAFDKRGGRIGYGAGYYDRLLPAMRKNVPVIGVCYDMQVVEDTYADVCDMAMTSLCTEKNFYDCNKYFRWIKTDFDK